MNAPACLKALVVLCAVLAPLAPGGGMDAVTRALAQSLTDALGQSVVVDNRPGAGSQVALEILADSVAKAFADPVVIRRLTELGQELPSREQVMPEALAAFYNSEIDKWWPLIKGANSKVE